MPIQRPLRHPRPLASWLAITITAGVLLCARERPARGQPQAPRVARPVASTRADASVAEAPVEESPGVSRTCPPDTVLVEGDWCVNADQKCLRWLDEPTQMQCAEFERPRCSGRRRHIAVCIDRYEYPNQPGVSPTVQVSWYDARRLCRAQNKRLCTESEWTFSCEGPALMPYPYGLQRDRTACRIDHQPVAPNHARLGDPRYVVDESARLYGAMPSGAMPRCVSWAGVHDMTGNVDEWTVNEGGVPFESALKGGWWGPIRARCRPATTAHNEGFVYYQIGFRCCADPVPPHHSAGNGGGGGSDGGSDAR